MSKFDLTIEGDEELIAALRKTTPRLRERAQQALDAIGLMLQTDIKRRYQRGPATGALRDDGSRASAPGEAPMSDTGDLARGVVYERVTGQLAVEIFSSAVTERGVDYGFVLEFGTRDGRIGERPAWRPALAENSEKALVMIRDAIIKALPDER